MEFNLLQYAKQYQDAALCQKWHNNIPLHVLSVHDDTMQYRENSQDIQALCDYFPWLPVKDVTGYVASIEDGGYGEVYVTEWSRPYDNYAIYHPLSYYVEE